MCVCAVHSLYDLHKQRVAQNNEIHVVKDLFRGHLAHFTRPPIYFGMTVQSGVQ